MNENYCTKFLKQVFYNLRNLLSSLGVSFHTYKVLRIRLDDFLVIYQARSPMARITSRVCGSTHFMQNYAYKFLYRMKLYSVAAAKSLQSCPTLYDPIDGSPPGSSVLDILQARTLEWVAISFSNV